MKKKYCILLAFICVCGFYMSCSSFSKNASSNSDIASILKDSLQSFVNGISQTISDKPLLKIDSITIERKIDTTDHEGWADMDHFIVWRASATILNDIKYDELIKKYHPNIYTTYNRYNSGVVNLLFSPKSFSTGQKITTSKIRSLFFSDKRGNKLKLWTLFDDQCDACYGEK